LLYEDVTTSYPAYMPTENYQKYIMDKMPKKEDGAGKWFIRPHHLETLTQHPKSIQDDVLNTRYVSHYNQQHGKKEEVNESQLAIEKIEAHLEALKSKQYYMMTQLGEDPDDLEELKHKTEREGLRQYEAFIQDKKRHDTKELLIQAYEDLLTSQRNEEKDALNRTRQIEYDKNRPP
jgi:vacuolar-type H+-ATPase subunit I/STV1